MKIVQINTTCSNGSTGKICKAISKVLTDNNIENYVFHTQNYARNNKFVRIVGKNYLKVQALKSRVFGNYGFNSNYATRKIIRNLKNIKPDIVHLHNIHGHNLNLKLFFRYIKKNNIKLFWTFHDCWAFTGYCVYFDRDKCEKWKTQCYKCPQYKKYSWFSDRSKGLFNLKKKITQGLDLTIITPSEWLKDLVKQSFLKDYPVKVINNGINLEIFKPTQFDFAQNLNLYGKKIVLGVASCWEKRKGLDVFIELSKKLDSNYQIVLVGTNDKIDKILPNNIISIHRTQNQKQLAEIYSTADVFVNPTREDNYPTVNMEAIACGTPVVTFKTGGSPEMIDDTCGSVVDCDDVNSLYNEVVRICEEKPFTVEACVLKAKTFDENEKFKEYIELYGK